MIRLANLNDLKAIISIYQEAKVRMKAAQIKQWEGDYPNQKLLEEDILGGHLFVFVSAHLVVGVMAVFKEEITYQNIIGSWLNDKPYRVIHRIAVKEGYTNQGIALKMLDFVLNHYQQDLKIDTHPDNIPMQKLLKKAQFVYCGKTYIGPKSNDLRWCYQKLYQG
ncbi:MAG: GNAT family N-acetyltransferase [Acholeplasmataceae bacterium]|nr:GNAT family N-acetyltransferase [Acholeplasmataceae bacterium]